MTHLLGASTLLAHYLAEAGAELVQSLVENESVPAGTCILALYEFELSLCRVEVAPPKCSKILIGTARWWEKSSMWMKRSEATQSRRTRTSVRKDAMLGLKS